jgi:hypothetical protein
VNDAFELLDPGNAQAFLKKFSPEARRLGQKIFGAGSVHALNPDTPGKFFSAEVRSDKDTFKTQLYYDPVEGWMGDCSCPQRSKCPHVFAAMRSLLAEHSSAVVRNLSASRSTGGAGVGLKGKTAEEPGLARRLLAHVGRPLNPEESKFIRKVSSTYERVRGIGHISRWDFQEMGFRLPGYGWDTLQIWPAFPQDEYEFWLYVVRAAEGFGLSIPEFMQPVSDLSKISDRVVRWERARAIEKWTRTFGNLRLNQIPARPASRGETDLRIMISEKEATLQWLRPTHENFDALKHNQIRQLSDDDRSARVHFTTEAALLWQLIANQFYYSFSSNLRYTDPTMMGALSRVLRTPLLHSRVVNRQGEPLARPAEPLRWQVVAARDEDDDYSIRLVQVDGSPAPVVRHVFEGDPALYLTDNAVFTGPFPQEILNPTGENRIPAPAIEQTAGVGFLQALGTELPERLREKVRRLKYQVVIKCELKKTYAGGSSEDCFVQVLAEAPDGHRLEWSGQNWFEPASDAVRPKRRQANAIVVYDSSSLAQVNPLVEPLNLKSSPYGQGFSLRVTKKFPEIFINWLKSVPPDIQVDLAGELASFGEAAVSGSVRLDVSEAAIDWFDLRVVLNVSDTTLSQDEIRLLLNAKGNYVRLQGKGWRRLQFDLSEEENERLAALGLNPRELSAEPQRLHALQLADDAAKKFLPAQQVEQIQRRATEIKARVAPEVPAGITAQLRPYQTDGFHFLSYLSTNRFGGILADDMGLGKTLQTLAWLLWLRGANGENSKPQTPNSKEIPSSKLQPDTKTANGTPSLVVCPKSVMDNWHAEASKFAPSLRVKNWPAAQLSSLPKQLDSADVHVINYSQLRLLGESLVPIQWQALILDEGQYIKNPSSQTAQIARALRADHRLILSGTPIENRLTDLWSLMAFAMPGILGSRAQFARLYDNKSDPFARRRLSSRVRPFLLRRTKAQVAKDLPDRIEEDLFCEIEGEQKTLYRAELKRAQQLLLRIKTQKELAQQQFHFLTSLLRLRQICCHPRLVQSETAAPSAKTEALLEQLEPLMEEGQKVLVFSQFVQLLDLLKPEIAARNWPTFYLAGDTENRGELVEKFQSCEGPAVFLISLKAGGFGLNLTAASYVVLFDPWWNPAVENQAIDRTHRIGQSNKVIAYRLLIKDSIEEKIRELQKQKKALAQDVLGEERFAQSLTLNDLQFLFAD